MSWLAVTFTTQEINSLIRAQRELTDVWRRLVKELESLVPRVAHVFLLFFSLGKHATDDQRLSATRGMVWFLFSSFPSRARVRDDRWWADAR